MKTAVAIFCKTPGISLVKTRLALEIGTKQAEEFYNMSIAAVKETMVIVKETAKMKVVPYWAVAERQSLYCSFWGEFETIWTGEGELGERIHNIFENLYQKYDNVIIIGSDSPQIKPKYILDAVQNLTEDSYDITIGPCDDGGFVLFGSKVLLPKAIWTEIEYSKDSTLLQLTERLDKAGFKYSYLPKMSDVDNFNDLEKLNYLLKLNERNNLPNQNRLIKWINNIMKIRKTG